MMKSKKLPIIYFLAAIVFFSCEDDKDTVDDIAATGNPVGIVENAHASGQTVSADFRGRIITKQGGPIAGASVSAGGSVTITNGQGFYQLEDAVVDQNYALIKVEFSGMFDQYRAVKPRPDQTNYVDIALIPKVVNGYFSTSSGGTINIPGGATVAFPEGELVTSGGEPYSGDVLVASTYLDPSDTRLMSYMPGSLAAIDEDGEAVGMVTYGMVGVELSAASNGQQLQLAGGRKATITMPLPETHTSHAPESIPLWYFDETAGIWQGEGSATRNGNSYVGQVSHFSFWNFDIPTPTVLVSGSVLYNAEPTSAWGLYLTVTRPNGTYVTVELDANGYFSGYTPTNEILTLEIFESSCFGNSDPIYTTEIGPFSDDATLDPIDLSDYIPADNSLIAFGSVIDCDGNPIENAIVNIQGSNFNTYATSGEEGAFSFMFSCIQSGSIILNILDPSSLTASDEVAFSFDVSTSNELSFGAIDFCDEESLPDFITYDDGVNQITFEEIDFDFTATGCQDLYAFNSGMPVVDFIEGLDVEIVAFSDSTNFLGCGTDPIVVQGYLPTGEYLFFSSGPDADYSLISTNVIEGDDETLYEGWIFLGQTAQNIQIYEDESMTVLVDEYFTEQISMTYQFIW